jgi:two-component system cell cycle sensor histidine kinase/response regulator CckA
LRLALARILLAVGSRAAGRGEVTASGSQRRRKSPSVRPLARAGLGAALLSPIAGTVHAAGTADDAVFAWGLSAVLAVLVAGALLLCGLAWRRARRSGADRATLAAAIEALPGAAAVTASDGARLWSNTAWDRLLARPGDRPLAAIEARAGDAAEARSDLVRLRAAAASGEPAEAEIALVDDEGHKRWCRVAAHRLAAPAGAVLWLLADAAGRNALDAALRSEQDRLRSLLMDAPIGFFAVDRNGRFVAANRSFAGWLGLGPDALADGKRRLHDLVAEADLSRCLPWSPFPEGGGGGQIMLKTPTGQGFLGLVALTELADESTGPRARAFVRNLTAEQQRADALVQSESRFHRFVDEAPVGIAMLDAAGTITECSAAFARMASPDGAVRRRLADLVDGDERGRVEQWIAAAVAADEAPPPLQVAFRGAGGIVASLFGRRFFNEFGGVGLVVHALDNTEQRRLEAQFFQSQKMELVGQLAGGVAHDFNNLLTAMIGFCDLLLQRHSAKDQSFADIMQIRQNANRAANLVRQLLAFSRQQTLQPKVLDIAGVVAELSHLLRRLIGANIELKLVHGRDLWLVKVDQSQLEQVIINLAVNARDAIGGAGVLTIQTRNLPASEVAGARHGPLPAANYVVITASDTGCGIPRENLDKIFEPFFTTKAVGSGTGLGLSTVYGIIKQTGGHIFVDSAPDEGAVFTIYLPRHEGAQEAERLIDEPRARGAKRDLTGMGTVLLVEDEDAVRMFGARALRNKGYNVVEAPSGEAALKLLDDGADRIDVLISDVVMPGMDGPSMVLRARDKRPGMKVIFISGYTEDSLRKRMEVAGDVHFLAKPFTLQQLAGKVKEIMAADAP